MSCHQKGYYSDSHLMQCEINTDSSFIQKLIQKAILYRNVSFLSDLSIQNWGRIHKAT